jgi:hypothetical protein
MEEEITKTPVSKMADKTASTLSKRTTKTPRRNYSDPQKKTPLSYAFKLAVVQQPIEMIFGPSQPYSATISRLSNSFKNRSNPELSHILKCLPAITKSF